MIRVRLDDAPARHRYIEQSGTRDLSGLLSSYSYRVDGCVFRSYAVHATSLELFWDRPAALVKVLAKGFPSPFPRLA